MFYKNYRMHLFYTVFSQYLLKARDSFHAAKKETNKTNKYIHKLNPSFLEKICIFFLEKYLGHSYICFVGAERSGRQNRRRRVGAFKLLTYCLILRI